MPTPRPPRKRTKDTRSTTSRGYGYPHQQERKRWAAILQRHGQLPCPRGCGHMVRPGDDWDLDHTDDRTAYHGPAHRTCNRRAGAKKGNARTRARRMVNVVTRIRW